MSAPEGHNSQASMLQGGEEAPIVPSQAGGVLKEELRKKFANLPPHIKNKINTYSIDDVNEMMAVITAVKESPAINDEQKADLLYTTIYNAANDADVDKELNNTTKEEKDFLESSNVINLDKNKKFLALSYFRESKSLKTRSNVPTDPTNTNIINTNKLKLVI